MYLPVMDHIVYSMYVYAVADVLILTFGGDYKTAFLIKQSFLAFYSDHFMFSSYSDTLFYHQMLIPI